MDERIDGTSTLKADAAEPERACGEEKTVARETLGRARPHRPQLGGWEGPIYGKLGVLAHDDDRVQCHCRRRWYRSLASHDRLRHHLSADEHRALFGLRHHTGLVGSMLSEVRRQNSTPRLGAFHPQHAHF
jgi:hypothetical protein